MVHRRTIAILGSNGFIGSNLLTDLKNNECIGITKDKDCVGDVVINANGNSKKSLPDTDPMSDFDLSVRSTLKSIISSAFNLYIYLSSCEVYTGDTTEDAVIDVTQVSRYGLSKYLAECLVKRYCKNWIILRLNGPIGPNMKKGPIYDITEGDRLWVSSESNFQFIHVNYISYFINTLLTKGITNETFNVTGRDSMSLDQAMNICGKRVVSPNNPIINHNFDVSKANAIVTIPTSLESLNHFTGKL